MRFVTPFSFLCLLLITFSCKRNVDAVDPHSLPLIPMPNSVTLTGDSLDVARGFNLLTADLPEEHALSIRSYLEQIAFPLSDKGVPVALVITAHHQKFDSKEGYALTIDRSGIKVEAISQAGLFYGLQTIIQLSETTNLLPTLEITDEPRFSYRGFHFDVSRHFYSIDFLKKQIDQMARLKLNHFHWHLTDGPGWRLQIKQYPELTGIAAWRTHESWKEWWASGRRYLPEGTPDAYGGYYTQEEARELVHYAAERQITIIPEIEMPGHSEEVLAVYPHLSCTGTPYSSSEFCIGNEATFSFLEGVLDEVLTIFPSQYIHVGGDEASREHWKHCSSCQSRMKQEGLKDEAELQSYLIRRVEQYLHAHGRKLIGWDEILEGGVDSSAVVMAWRGEEIGIRAAEKGHRVIMTPGAYAYFDSYQGEPASQPEAIGGFLPLEKVYGYNPESDTLSAITAGRISGVQANLWTEYIGSEEHAEYMIYPRLLAMAEVAWTLPVGKNWEGFRRRVNREIPRLKQRGYHPYELSREPHVTLMNDTLQHKILIDLSSELEPVEIRYTTDGETPDAGSMLYESPIEVGDSAFLQAQLFRNGEAIGDVVSRRVDYHKAIGKKMIYHTPFSRYYPAGGVKALIDGLPGGLSHGDGRWQGFNLREIDLEIDLQEELPLHSLQLRFLQNGNAWIWFPREVTLLVSGDGETYRELQRFENSLPDDLEGTHFQPFHWSGTTTARFIRLKLFSNGNPGGWIFLDEIVVW